MKTAIVPAQMTTVEDKVAGNLSLTQLILLAIPVFVGGILYALLPPSFSASVYKFICMGILGFLFVGLSVRIKGQLVLVRVKLLIVYMLRPRFYVQNKNSTYGRFILKNIRTAKTLPEIKEINRIQLPSPQLSVAQRIQYEQRLVSSTTKLEVRHKKKKDGLYVTISEI